MPPPALTFSERRACFSCLRSVQLILASSRTMHLHGHAPGMVMASCACLRLKKGWNNLLGAEKMHA